MILCVRVCDKHRNEYAFFRAPYLSW